MGDIIQLWPKETQADGEETLAQMADVNDVISECEIIWHCTHCGYPLFFITKERGILCQACGQVQTWNNDK